ncbi:guanylate cyclase 32e [Plakobranchus ocellatus]|uniref:Guanylate cyclase 32e n=1 Tax=Plakobranchus ocellatus TaxID=259542 RepID=A0AAV4AAN7_9GAST|nr:guanylate cyclase 32e [Plakobranchus ocellatus]
MVELGGAMLIVMLGRTMLDKYSWCLNANTDDSQIAAAEKMVELGGAMLIVMLASPQQGDLRLSGPPIRAERSSVTLEAGAQSPEPYIYLPCTRRDLDGFSPCSSDSSSSSSSSSIMNRFYLRLSCVLFLVGCALFESASGALAVGKPATRTIEGLSIETSARYLSTVLRDGVCMSVTCSYTPTDSNGKPPAGLSRLTLRRYNKNSASYNIIVDAVSVQNPVPENAKDAYSAVGDITNSEASLQVNVTSQDICQFAVFQCLLDFEDQTALSIESDDNLPFAEDSSNEQWLQRVTEFIKSQMSSLNRKMSKSLFSLEVQTENMLKLFQNDVIRRAHDSIASLRSKLSDALEKSVAVISTDTQKLRQGSSDGVKVLQDTIQIALQTLNTGVSDDISNAELNLRDSLRATNEDIAKKITELDKVVIDRVDSVQVDAGQLSSDLGKQVELFGTNINDYMAKMLSNIAESIIKFEKNISTETEDIQQSHKKDTGDVLKLFAAEFKSTRMFLDKQITTINEKFSNVSTLISTHIEKLQERTSNLTENLGENIVSTVGGLKKDVNEQVQKLDENVSSKVSSVASSVAGAATGLSTRLGNLDSTVAKIVENFQQSVVKQIGDLQSKVDTGMASMATIINNEVEKLGYNVGETSVNLEGQINKVNENTTRSLSHLQATTLRKIQFLNAKLSDLLATVRTKLVKDIEKLSADLSDTRQTGNSALSSDVSQLNQASVEQINTVSQLLLSVIDDVYKQQAATTNKMSTQFGTLLAGLDEQLKTLQANTETEIGKSTQTIESSVDDLKSTLRNKENSTQAAITLGIETLRDLSVADIADLKGRTLEKINNILLGTSQEITNVLAEFEKQSQSIGTSNSDIQLKLTTMISKDMKNILEYSSKLDGNFDSRREIFENVASKLKNLDENFQDLQESSKSSLDTISNDIEKEAESYSEKIDSINKGLTDLGKVRQEGQTKLASEFNDINFYLSNTTTLIFNELNSNFDQVDEMVRRTDKTLTNYLRPEVCQEGMSFMASSQLTYVVIPPSNEIPYDFLCDAHTTGGGWIVIQKRKTGDTDFFRNFNDYEIGFGSVYEDFWMGLERIHQLTAKDEYELRVDMTYQGSSRYAQYGTFSVGDSASRYTMTLGDYSGTAGDSMFDTNSMKFSTYDEDNDKSRRTNCASSNAGGWWYNDCQYANLNGWWGRKDENGVRWNSFSGTQPLVTTEMKIRLKKKPQRE